MEKVETVKNPADVGVVAAQGAAKEVADKAEKARLAKNEAAKRFTERKREERKTRIENAQKFIDILKKKNIWKDVPEDLQKWMQDVATPKSFGTTSLFTQLFGDAPKVGDKISLMEAMTKTLKGKTDIERAAKGWAEKGTIVEFKAAPKLIDSVFEIKTLA
jgi:hypothetical protein